MTDVSIATALLSVSDKRGLADLAGALASCNVKLLSTGGTWQLLKEHQFEAGIDVQDVSDYTGFPEIMDGRVKTLHPRVHGGLLGRRAPQGKTSASSGGGADDAAVMAEHGITPIDLLVVNLYPFEAAIAESPDDLHKAIENIDIGGPAMLRSAAKNFHSVAVVVDPDDYAAVMDEMTASNGQISLDTRFKLAAKAFQHVARYDAAIANHFSALHPDGARDEYPASITLQFERLQTMRYGENPHQTAAFYGEAGSASASAKAGMTHATQLQGKALSFNNVVDADAAAECVLGFDEPACVIVKHANPCGVAVAGDALAAYDRAFSTDPTSAFGGIIAFNRGLDERLAKAIIERQFVEVILCPEASAEAEKVVATKKNVRLLVVPSMLAAGAGGERGDGQPAPLDYKRVAGGLLIQQKDMALHEASDLKVVTTRQPDEREYRDLLFAWRVAKYVKSNAIVYARDGMTVGIGAGQMSRVVSARIAGLKAAEAGLEVAGSVMASDAFFPFRDGIDAAAAEGIAAVIQPGGSVRDQEVIDAANEAGMTMLFTGMRHFRH